jgi:hypothetical protein
MRCVRALSVVMPALSRPKDGVASLAYVAGIHVFLCCMQDVDGRDKPAMTAQHYVRPVNFCAAARCP